MTSEILEAAQAAVRQSAGPMTVAQIRSAVKRDMKIPRGDRFAAEIREGLPGQAGIHLWPAFRGSPLFYSRSLAECVKEALLRALEEEPLNVTKVAQAVKKALKCVSETQVVKELRVLLPQMSAAGVIVRLAVGRQPGIYLSRSWMAKQARAEGGEGGDGTLKAVILEAVARMESGPGNYVRVDKLRMAPEIRTLFDRAAVDLARAGRLVLGRYQGPLPVPENEEWVYIRADAGDLFLGVALPRNEEA